jgi:hypothetical protein
MCNFSRGTNLKLKAFAGAIDVKGTPPRTSQFRLNDLAEVGLRLDKNIQRVNRIAALETDLFLPLFLPIPRNLMILPRQMKGRIFYDLGISDQPHKMIRAGGAGFFLPLGGDLSGAGSLTISRVSLLAILYQDIHGEISRKPTVLFDLSGDL